MNDEENDLAGIASFDIEAQEYKRTVARVDAIMDRLSNLRKGLMAAGENLERLSTRHKEVGKVLFLETYGNVSISIGGISLPYPDKEKAKSILEARLNELADGIFKAIDKQRGWQECLDIFSVEFEKSIRAAFPDVTDEAVALSR